MACSKLNGIFFDCETVNHGVQQGSVLGPLIFLYMNDFSSIINTRENIIQFADDTSVVCCGKESSLQGREKSEKFCKKTEEYVEMNKLILNTNETDLIFFSRKISGFGSIFYNKEVPTTRKQIPLYSNN